MATNKDPGPVRRESYSTPVTSTAGPARRTVPAPRNTSSICIKADSILGPRPPLLRPQPITPPGPLHQDRLSTHKLPSALFCSGTAVNLLSWRTDVEGSVPKRENHGPA